MIKFFFKYYFTLLFWAALIFYFSSVPSLQYGIEIKREILLRKSAHFIEYGILAILFWRLFYAGYRFTLKRSFFYSLFWSVLYAISDEFHQTLVVGRSGKFIDILFDALSALLILEFFLRRRDKALARKMFGWQILTFFILVAMLFMMLAGAQTVKTEEIKIEDNNPGNYRVQTSQIKDSDVVPARNIEIPAKFKISVPFTSQAPAKNWDEFHEEACEEAALVMLKYYLDKRPLSPDLAEKEIQNLIRYQNEHYGDYRDTTAAETAKLAEDYYDITNLKVIYDFTPDDLKKYLALARPIIVPTAGRLLGNPYFTAPGPLYHNLVLTGYEENTIITNDPGTKRGLDYKYDIKILYNAIHDFPGQPEDIEKGRKAMIVIE